MKAARPASSNSRHDLGTIIRLVCRAHDPEDVQDALVALANRVSTDDVLRSLQHHRLTSCFYLGVRGRAGDLEPRLLSTTKHVHSLHSAHHLRTLIDLSHVARELAGAGVSWGTFKGPVLAETAYLRPHMRMYSDLDIVVSVADVPRAIKALASDPTTATALAETSRQQGVHQTSFTLPLGTPVDLHWDLLSLPEARDQFPMPLAGFMRALVPVTADGFTCWTFDREHTLLHLVAHTGLSGGDRGIWIKDIAEVIRTAPPDWDRFADLAGAMNLGLMAGVVLDRVKALTGIAPPDAPLPTLRRHSVWARSLRLAERVRPLEESVGAGRSGQLLVRSTRADTRSSIAALGAGERRRLVRWREGSRHG